MMIKLAESRSESELDELASAAEQAGKRYIAVASQIMDGST